MLMHQARLHQAVDEAERVEAVKGDSATSSLKLEVGSDVEVAQRILEKLEDIYGRTVVADGQVWRFDGYAQAIPQNRVRPHARQGRQLDF